MKNFVNVDTRFQKSINLTLDTGDMALVNRYIPTRSSVSILKQYLTNIVRGQGEHATILIGPYGKGKSHLLLVLLALLQNRNDKKWENSITRFYEKIKKQNKRLAACIEKNILCGRENKKRYLPVIISFGRSSLENSYKLALFQALEREKITNLMPDSIYDEVLKKTESWKKDYPETYERFTKKSGKCRV